VASPIGHALAGYSVYLISEAACKDAGQRSKYHLVWLPIFMAIAADLDFIPGLVRGTPALYHQGVSHSFGAAVALSLAVASFAPVFRHDFFRLFRLCFLSYLSHPIIDFFGPDGRLPYGIPLFWPMSDEHFLSPVALFRGMHHAGSTHGSTLEWISGIFSLRNVFAVIVEVAWMMPFILIGTLYARRRHGRHGSV
jgi:inner membrane protein